MKHNGPVVVIEDDEDDQMLLKEVFQKLGYSNKVIFFTDGQKALDYLNQAEVLPFLILSDINMPKLNGLELRQKLKLDAALQLTYIPYIFFSTAAGQKAVVDAYSLSAQGFFVKQYSIDEIEKTISAIMEYWKRCEAPNDYPGWFRVSESNRVSGINHDKEPGESCKPTIPHSGIDKFKEGQVSQLWEYHI